MQLGLEGDDLVEIVSGLNEDERVLPTTLPIGEGDPVRLRRGRGQGEVGASEGG